MDSRGAGGGRSLEGRPAGAGPLPAGLLVFHRRSRTGPEAARALVITPASDRGGRLRCFFRRAVTFVKARELLAGFSPPNPSTASRPLDLAPELKGCTVALVAEMDFEIEDADVGVHSLLPVDGSPWLSSVR